MEVWTARQEGGLYALTDVNELDLWTAEVEAGEDAINIGYGFLIGAGGWPLCRNFGHGGEEIKI